MVKRYTCIPSLTLLSCYIILAILGLVIPFQREMNAINIQCDLRLFGNAPNSNAPKKGKEEILKTLRVQKHIWTYNKLEMKQQNNHVDDIHLYVLPKFQTKKNQKKLLLSYVPHFDFCCVFVAKGSRAKNCLSQFFAASRPPYEPFQRIQVPPAESGWLDPKWVDVFPGYKHGGYSSQPC